MRLWWANNLPFGRRDASFFLDLCLLPATFSTPVALFT